MTTKRTLMPLALCAALLAGGHAVPLHSQQQVRPNILLIHADDLGYGDVSVYGQSQFATPSLDRLARGGIRFTQYYSGSTVCAPSRTALMLGQHMGHAWIRGNGDIPLRDEDVTVAEVLRTVGYRTAVIGKWGLGTPGTSGQPDRQGFDYAFGFLDHRHAHRQYTDHLYRNGERVAVDLEKDYVNDLFTKEAAAFIEKDPSRPFFLYLNYTVPHAELRAPEDSMAPFAGKFQEKPFVNPKADARQAGAQPDAVSLGYRSQPTPKAAFAAMITRMDRDIGRLLDLLRTRGIERNTLVMFTSDNGPHREGGADPAFFNSSGPLRGIKRDLYEGGIRVPMIASWPGTVPAGRASDHVWAHWDMLPTLADITGAKPPSGLDGRSMARALRGETQPASEFLYWEFHERGFQQAVRMGSWKAVRLKKDAPLELYDLSKDLAETKDVAAANPEIVAKIETYLKTARTESDRWPVKEEASPIVGSEFIYESAPFPSAHASTIVETPQGLVAAWFGGTAERNPDVGIWVSRRERNAWSMPVEVATGVQPDGKRLPCWNPVLFQVPDGPLILFYKVGPSPSTWWGLARQSTDNGRTWSDAVKLPDGILGPIRAKPVALADGSLLAGSSTEHEGWVVHMERFSSVKNLARLENLADPKHWQKTGPLNDAKEFGAIQPTILVHSPQRLQILCRSRQQVITETWSDDAGRTWSPMKATTLPNPSAGIDALRLADGRFLLVYNPTAKGRDRLEVAVSQDGKSWRTGVVLESTPPGEYSYPAMIQTRDGRVHVTYTWRRQRIRHAVVDPQRLK